MKFLIKGLCGPTQYFQADDLSCANQNQMGVYILWASSHLQPGLVVIANDSVGRRNLAERHLLLSSLEGSVSLISVLTCVQV